MVLYCEVRGHALIGELYGDIYLKLSGVLYLALSYTAEQWHYRPWRVPMLTAIDNTAGQWHALIHYMAKTTGLLASLPWWLRIAAARVEIWAAIGFGDGQWHAVIGRLLWPPPQART